MSDERFTSHSNDRQEVAAAAILHDGAILLAQRTYPPELAGMWELPGGKVHEGELPTEALRRELEEELGVTAAVGSRIGVDVPVGDSFMLRAYLVRVINGEPEPLEHAAVRWFSAAELRDAPLVPNDRVWVDDLCRELAASADAEKE